MTTTNKPIQLRPQGGIMWAIYEGEDYVASFEFGALDEDGQYVQDDDEVIEHACDEYGYDPKDVEVIG